MAFLIGGANSAADTGFSVANSCRFDKGSSSFLDLTFGTPTNGHIWNFSCWTKRTNLGSGTPLWAPLFGDSGSPDCRFYFREDDFRFDGYHASGAFGFQTTQLFRDVSAWYHVCILWDGTQAVAGNRAKLFINGIQVTAMAVSDPPDQNAQHSVNTAIEHYIGRIVASQYTNVYMAQVCFVDGTVYAISDFGEFNEDSPTIWQPKDVSGLTFGNNGFLLDFADSSALGKDVSGKGNDWASNGLDATDQSTDTPTNNFATINGLELYPSGATLAEGNLKLTTGGNEIYSFNNSTIAVSSGKWYAEVKVTTTTTDDANMIGISAESPIYQRSSPWGELGDSAYAYAYIGADGAIRNNNSESSHGDAYSTDAIIGIYLDLDNNKLYFGKDGTIQNSGTGVSITAAASTPTGHYFISAGNYHNNAAVFEVNFGNPVSALSSAVADANGYGSFEYDPSAGTFDSASKTFYALCTKNLAEFG